MIQRVIPSELRYRVGIPKTFPCVQKMWDADPVTNSAYWQNDQIIRIDFSNYSKGGIYDPSRSYLQIGVKVSVDDLPVGLLQLDSSPHSFIQQLVLRSRGAQVERITDYSVLMAYRTDVQHSDLFTIDRQSQGYGTGNFQTMPITRNNLGHLVCAKRSKDDNRPSYTCSPGTIFPTIGNAFPRGASYIENISIYDASKMSKGHNTNANPIMTGTDFDGGTDTYKQKTVIQASIGRLGYGNNMRVQYLLNGTNNNQILKPQSTPAFQMYVDKNVSNSKYPFNYNPKVPYTIGKSHHVYDQVTFDHKGKGQSHLANCANYGYSSLFSPLYTRGTFQPFISPTVPQLSMQNGLFIDDKLPVAARTFKVVLASNILGRVTKRQQIGLLPLACLNNLLGQFTLDKYAMFTSGYSDYCQLDTVGINVQQKRCWKITKFRMKIPTYHFLEQQASNYIQTSLYKQINFVVDVWQRSNVHQIPANSPAGGSYSVGTSPKNLVQLVALFGTNQWQYFSGARKHTRASNCVTIFWAKVGYDYWPPQPIKGNGGNPLSPNYQDDNSQYLANIYKQFQLQFSADQPIPRINSHSFAINEKPYNVKNNSTFYDLQMENNQQYQFSQKSVNADMGLGCSWLNQNRAVGKAAYVLNFTPFFAQKVIKGVNIQNASNFELLFETASGVVYPQSQTLYIFTKCAKVLNISTDGIRVFDV